MAFNLSAKDAIEERFSQKTLSEGCIKSFKLLAEKYEGRPEEIQKGALQP